MTCFPVSPHFRLRAVSFGGLLCRYRRTLAADADVVCYWWFDEYRITMDPRG